MRIYLRGKVYWFELVFNGERIQRSTKVRNARIAGQVASAFHTALAKGEVGITERKIAPAFDAAMKSFLAWSKVEHAAKPGTHDRYVDSSHALLRYFGKTPLDRISSQDVESFKTARAGEKGISTGRKLKPATVNRELACLRKLFNNAIKGNPDLRNPVDGVGFLKENNQQDRVLTFAEQRAYLEHAAEVLRDVAGLILELGTRPGEIFTLRSAAVDLDGGYLQIVEGKTRAARRRIELTPESHRILSGRIERVPPGYLFPREHDATRPISSVQSQHTRALKASKVLPFRPYDLRHTWATRAAQAGVDLVTLAAMLGHSRIEMVLRYAHPTQAHQTSATEKITAHKLDMEARERAKAELESTRRGGRASLRPGLRVIPKMA